MKQAKRSGRALHRLTLAVIWRQRRSSALLAGIAALGVFASVALHHLAVRQEEAIADMVANARIRCVVTDARGMNSENLGMLSFFVDMLMGLRHERGCYLDEYVRDVRAKGSVPLQAPENTVLRRILNFDSDSALSAVGGASVQMSDGWTEAVFGTKEKVCLISEGMTPVTGPDGLPYMTVLAADGVSLSLQVVGTVSGGSENVIWCPFYIQRQPGISEAFTVESCSFDIGDNARLEECKAAIFETFVEPDLSAGPGGGLTYGVLVQDETYRSTLEEFQSNLATLRLLLPILAALSGAIGFFASYLAIRGRIREFAVMRCLGVKGWRVFLLVFEEQVLLAAVGAAAGSLAGFLLEGAVSGEALLRGGLNLAVFLAGSAASVWGISRVNVMKLMKEED